MPGGNPALAGQHHARLLLADMEGGGEIDGPNVRRFQFCQQQVPCGHTRIVAFTRRKPNGGKRFAKSCHVSHFFVDVSTNSGLDCVL